MPTLFVMVGLPGAGKTTRAREIERSHRAVRLSPDDWMIPLFGAYESGRARDVLEGRMIALALELLRRGLDVVLDFGVWSRAERSALRHLATSSGASCELVYQAIDEAEQRRRVESRVPVAGAPAITVGELDRARDSFEAPSADELDGRQLDDPPAGSGSWEEWIASRWPTVLEW